MLKESAENILKELPYCKNLTYKIEDGTLKFYYSSSRFTRLMFLRSFVENNFKVGNKFYTELEKAVNWIRSDYQYIDNKPVTTN